MAMMCTIRSATEDGGRLEITEGSPLYRPIILFDAQHGLRINEGVVVELKRAAVGRRGPHLLPFVGIDDGMIRAVGHKGKSRVWEEERRDICSVFWDGGAQLVLPYGGAVGGVNEKYGRVAGRSNKSIRAGRLHAEYVVVVGHQQRFPSVKMNRRVRIRYRRSHESDDNAKQSFQKPHFS